GAAPGREGVRDALIVCPAQAGLSGHRRGADRLLSREPAAFRDSPDRRVRRAADHVDRQSPEVHTARAREDPVSSEFFRPPLDYPRIPYDQVLSHGAEHYPENVAIVFREVSLTYRELEALTNRFARALAALGVAKGDRVCILSPNCPEYIIAFYAIARIGAVASPMNPSYREREIEYQLNDTEATAAVVRGRLVPSAENVRPHPPHLEHVISVGPGQPTGSSARSFAELIASQPATPPAPVAIREDDLVALPYSSGTTGLPKG